MSERLLKAAQVVAAFLRCSDEVFATYDIHYSAADKLRQEARRLEERDAAIVELRAAIREASGK